MIKTVKQLHFKILSLITYNMALTFLKLYNFVVCKGGSFLSGKADEISSCENLPTGTNPGQY